jgi:hypothetical protein
VIKLEIEKIKELVELALHTPFFDKQFEIILELAELLEIDVSDFKD